MTTEATAGRGTLDPGSARKRKLFALLVGVSDYQDDVLLNGDGVIFPKLSGCKSDALKMQDYLKEDSSFDLESLVLTDGRATKGNIIAAFNEHLAKATNDDVVVFYYSGHGTQEYVDQEIFPSETDGKSESIVCYYTKDTASQALLSDKELRWLIGKLQIDDAHVVALFDCCHSAGATRNAVVISNSFPNVVEKRIYYTFPQRDWSDYAFAESLPLEVFRKATEASALPEGRHIQISACESYESALEVDAEGVFTKTLLKILRASKGSISYSSLLNQMRQYLQGVFEQKPRMYYSGTDDYLSSTLFLDKAFRPARRSMAELVYNEENGWILNRGAIHGMEGFGKLKVYHPDAPDRALEALVERTGTDYSYLTAVGLETDTVYQAYLPQLLSEKINLFIPANTAHLEDQEKILDGILEELSETVVLKDSELDADFVIRYLNGFYYITLPNDPFRPLAQQVEVIGEVSRVQLLRQIEQLSAREYIRKLKNTNEKTALREDSIKIEVSSGGSPYHEYSSDRLDLEFVESGDGWHNTLKVKLSNLSEETLYCSAIYLPFDLASFTGFLNPSVYALSPASSVELNIQGNPVLSLRPDEAIKWYNWESYREHFKILISTEIFNTEAFIMERLPSPIIPGKTVAKRSVDYGVVPKAENKGWFVKDIDLHFKAPEYNRISRTDLDTMLADEKTTFFALGLYYEPYNTDAFEFEYRPRPEILLADSEGLQKSLIIDLANKFARGKRNRKYRRDIERFPERVRIVSEGDSWFQHPLVHDVIDHVSRAFPIYCVAAAADTFRNIMSGDKKRGEYFLDALRTEKPAVFLISGGGNDILGSQFRSYLTETPDECMEEGTMPERFLKSSLMDEVRSLMEIYGTMFVQLEKEFPDLEVVVHGYDYPVKLDDAKKGWLGRYMIAKGISRPGDRQAIIRYIMDGFNGLLEAEANRCKNVTYLDLRKTVRYDAGTGVDQWYDEIHPDHDGFQQVSARFIRKINDLIA